MSLIFDIWIEGPEEAAFENDLGAFASSVQCGE
jgi:hypothetical protein